MTPFDEWQRTRGIAPWTDVHEPVQRCHDCLRPLWDAPCVFHQPDRSLIEVCEDCCGFCRPRETSWAC